ncbi:MAG: hypothetical protein IKM30_07460 [Oscillospiraceae bacterium]|nr:hypothetical protein [Oscillospiraceae bacterium]
MEFLITIIILFVLLLLLGVPLQTLLTIAVILIFVLLCLLMLFFMGTLLFLCRFRSKTVRFCRFQSHPRFDQAVYLEEDSGLEFVNLFPAESVLRSKIYHNAPQRLLLLSSGRHRFAFDRHSILILVLGFLGSGAGLAIFSALLMFLRQIR